MKVKLTPAEEAALIAKHKAERDGRVRDRIKAVLLCAKGWTLVRIAEALLISPETVHAHIYEYIKSKKLKPENGGSVSKLNDQQTIELAAHLENTTYVKVSEICAHVSKKYAVTYSVAGMTDWLHSHGFSYKKPKGVPAKADPVKQTEFTEIYKALIESTPEDEPILFVDGVHPTMATKVTYGWIRKGRNKPIATVASRVRVNIMGAIYLKTMHVVAELYETIDSDAMCKYFSTLKAIYPMAPKIHLILDRGPYNTSLKTRKFAEENGIILRYLPPYSPNLNPIERLWKVFNEYVRNNRVFASAKEFRYEIMKFFDTIWPRISNAMRNRINDRFQQLKWVSSG